MQVLVSGSGGLVGTALRPALETAGHQVVLLLRRGRGPGGPPASGAGGPAGSSASWDLPSGSIDAAALEGLDAVVHLAGETIAQRWTEARKRRIRDSRVAGTGLLAGALARLSRRPAVMVCASAIGYYGDRGEEILTERSASGTGFLPEVCRAWEAAALPAAEAGIRVVHLRFGVVLSAGGGALARMLPPFRLGAGGVLGDGSQFMSWIALDDAVAAILHGLGRTDLAGAANAVSPRPVSNREFTKTLGRVLSRPTLFPMPAFVARALFGEMADALLLSSARVEPARLLETGFRFAHSDLEAALRHLLRR